MGTFATPILEYALGIVDWCQLPVLDTILPGHQVNLQK
jgi:hypothetical protein